MESRSVIMALAVSGVLLALGLGDVNPWQLAVTVLGLVFVGLILLLPRQPGRPISSTGKAVLITGCDSGFGNLLARCLHEKGFHVFACCMFPDKGGAKELSEFSASRMRVLRLDITSDEDVKSAVDILRSEIGELDLWALINNAGLAIMGEVEWATLDSYTDIMSVNAIGMVRVTKAFLPFIRKSKGRIINVASIAGWASLPMFSAYCMSKHAVMAFSGCLRIEMRRFGVTVHTVEPGFYRTPMTTVESHQQKFKRMWNTATEEVKAVYNDAYMQKVQEKLGHVAKKFSPNVSEVIECLEDAVTSPQPKISYAPNFKKALILKLVRAVLPTSYIDKHLNNDIMPTFPVVD